MEVPARDMVFQGWSETQIQSLNEIEAQLKWVTMAYNHLLITSGEESRHILVALEALATLSDNIAFPRKIPFRWVSLFRDLCIMKPDLRIQAAVHASQMFRRVFGSVHAPIASPPAKSESKGPSGDPLVHEEEPSGVHPFDTLTDSHFQPVIGLLSPASRAQLASTCRRCRAMVQTWRGEHLQRFSSPLLKAYLPYFFEHIPDAARPETFDAWRKELEEDEVIPTLLNVITHSFHLNAAEKRRLCEHSAEEIGSNPLLLQELLQVSYNLSLVCAAAPNRERTDISLLLCSLPTLEKKTEAARRWFQVNQQKIIFLSHDGDFRRTMTCLPYEIRFLTNLRILSLAKNKLRILPDAIDSQPKLWNVDLSHNLLHTIPQRVALLPMLRRLNLEGNPIDSLPGALYTRRDVIIGPEHPSTLEAVLLDL